MVEAEGGKVLVRVREGGGGGGGRCRFDSALPRPHHHPLQGSLALSTLIYHCIVPCGYLERQVAARMFTYMLMYAVAYRALTR